MRHIKKTSEPACLQNNKASFSNWGDFRNPCKAELKQSLLKEQDGLCVYCESDLSIEDRKSHIEHVRPRSRYPKLTFEYFNLVASCEGICSESNKGKQSCGHRKDDHYDEKCFLNPVECEDIAAHFKFDEEKGAILPSDKNPVAAQHTIDVLNLNAPYLCNARRNAKQVFIDYFSRQFDFEKLSAELNQPREFVSFLRYCFAPFLMELS